MDLQPPRTTPHDENTGFNDRLRNVERCGSDKPLREISAILQRKSLPVSAANVAISRKLKKLQTKRLSAMTDVTTRMIGWHIAIERGRELFKTMKGQLGRGANHMHEKVQQDVSDFLMTTVTEEIIT